MGRIVQTIRHVDGDIEVYIGGDADDIGLCFDDVFVDLTPGQARRLGQHLIGMAEQLAARRYLFSREHTIMADAGQWLVGDWRPVGYSVPSERVEILEAIIDGESRFQAEAAELAQHLRQVADAIEPKTPIKARWSDAETPDPHINRDGDPITITAEGLKA